MAQSIKKFSVVKEIKFLVLRMLLIRRAIKEYKYDAKCFLKESMINGYESSEGKFIAKLTLHAHVVEKGLTMPDMRVLFGQDNLNTLIDLCFKYAEMGYNQELPLFKSAVSVIKEYKSVHQAMGVSLPSALDSRIEKIEAVFPEISIEGQCQYNFNKDELFKSGDFYDIAHKRHSVRNFHGGTVDVKQLDKALDLARTSPSACNRQPVKVFVISKGETFNKMINLQKGNRGFGDSADKLLVVTSTLTGYNSLNERNGAYVDGGIYVMNLLYSLHYYGIAACTLNCSFDSEDDSACKRLLHTSNVPVAIIAIGDSPEYVKAAKSHRRNFEEMVQYISE